MSVVYLNIGSNKGDRQAHIERAVALIEQLCGSVARRAPLYESEPWGYDSVLPFLNLGIAIECSMEPLDLLHSLQSIEQEVSPTPHRDMAGNYIDREIDIDIIAIDEMVIDSAELTLPHCNMHLREFVLVPLQFLAPEWRHPILGLTASQMLSQL